MGCAAATAPAAGCLSRDTVSKRLSHQELVSGLQCSCSLSASWPDRALSHARSFKKSQLWRSPHPPHPHSAQCLGCGRLCPGPLPCRRVAGHREEAGPLCAKPRPVGGPPRETVRNSRRCSPQCFAECDVFWLQLRLSDPVKFHIRPAVLKPQGASDLPGPQAWSSSVGGLRGQECKCQQVPMRPLL